MPVNRRWRFWALLVGILLFAAALRTPHVFADRTASMNSDERRFVPPSMKYGGGDLNPHWFYGPPLPSYLIFAGQLARYGAGRALGDVTSPLDFKAQYLVDPGPAVFTGRIVMLLVSLASIAYAAYFARDLHERLLGRPAGEWTGLLAALGLASSPLYIERSAIAMPEPVVVLAFTVTVHFAVRLVFDPGLRAAAVAGALSGVAAGSKYNGALSCLVVGAACLLAPGVTLRKRVLLVATSAAAFVGAFLAVCPWAILDSHVWWTTTSYQLFESRYRPTGSSYGFYPVVLWDSGLGPVWTVLAVVGAVIACSRMKAWTAAPARARAALLGGLLVVGAYLAHRLELLVARQILPLVPAFIVLATVELASVAGAAGRVLRIGAAVAALGYAAAMLPRYGGLPRTDEPAATHEVAAQWIRENVPDGAYVICDLHHPWLVRWEDREAMRPRLPARTIASMTPAYRWNMAFVRFSGELCATPGSEAMPDDWAALRKLGPVYVVVTTDTAMLFDRMAPGEYAALTWYRRVRAELPLVHAVEPEGLQGPRYEIYRVN